jgi:hypothetical protein
MKFLLLDADRSLSAIGGKEEVLKLSGFPPVPINDGVEQVNRVMKKLLAAQVREIEHPLFGKTEETIYTPTPLAVKEGLTGVVVDTISVAFDQTTHKMTAPLAEGQPPRQMEMRDWGLQLRFGMDFLITQQKSPFWTIVNCHLGKDKDGSTGAMLFGPQIKGSTGDQLEKFFDIVLFARVRAAKGGTAQFYWQTKPDPQRNAKDRLNILEPEMAQDFSVIFKRYAAKGWTAPKILVIGDSGVGKTTALRTIPPKID